MRERGNLTVSVQLTKWSLQGFKHVSNFGGGHMAWVQNGLKVKAHEKPADHRSDLWLIMTCHYYHHVLRTLVMPRKRTCGGAVVFSNLYNIFIFVRLLQKMMGIWLKLCYFFFFLIYMHIYGYGWWAKIVVTQIKKWKWSVDWIFLVHCMERYPIKSLLY